MKTSYRGPSRARRPAACAILLILAGVFPCVALAQGQPPAGVKSDCAADGYVVNAVTGEPVPRAHLIVMPAQLSSVADNAGRFAFSNLPCRRLQITASRPGFLTDGAGMPRGPSLIPMMLTSGSPQHDIKIQLTPQSVVLGKVLDESGDPVQGAQISVLSTQVMDGHRVFQMMRAAQTDDLGEFRIPSLSAGKFIFCATETSNIAFIGLGNGKMVSAEVCYPGPIEGGVASAMQLLPGREARVEFSVSQVPAVHVRGTVSGMPKNQNVAVTLQRRGLIRGPNSIRPANILPDGRFDVRGVTPGSYVLATDYWEAGNRLTARVPVDVGSSDVEGVVVQLEPGISLTGTVRVESTTGNTAAPQGWTLSLRAADPISSSGQIKWTKDRTAFTFGEMIPGNYRLGLTGPPPPFYVKSATLGGRDLTREEVPIMQSGGPLEIVLSDDGGAIEGTVEDANGQAAGGWVMAIQDGKQPHNQFTGADGHFTLRNLAPGDYRVYAWDDSSQVEYADADWMRRHAGASQTVTVTGGQTAPAKLVVQTAGQ